jgi:threonyl-tRNA synthetase
MSAEQDVTAKNERTEMMRHSAAHVMAAAVQEMFPDVKFGIGPAIANGFYYDFELPRPLTPEDLPEIETRMKKLVKAKQPFERDEASIDEARKIFANQPYKLELIDDIAAAGDDKVIIYRQGNFTDLCRGPHVEHTGRIGSFKLRSIAGAYWRGDEHRPMLQRIYAIAFPDKTELKAHLEKLEEAARRDHRKLGRDLDLFSLRDEVGPGLALWHPKGGTVRRIIEDFWRQEHVRRGYDIVYTPHIARADLWKTSGHLDFYRENLYSPIEIDEQQYLIKPMNCVYHILIYQARVRSYRELPLRYAELGTVYRYERSGVLHGLSRVRAFTQDDAHIFCRPDQLNDEINDVMELALYMTKTFGFSKFKVMLSTRPEKSVGSAESWEMATDILRQSLDKSGLEYEVDEGGGAFYGPKIDIKFEDAQERQWQGPTIQVDFNLPERFDVNYIGEDGAEHRVVMVHRTVLGSMERHMATLIEHYGGAFPVWLAPVQAAIIPVADRHLEYAGELAAKLRAADIRVSLDSRSERINQKIRQAQLEKIPYMLVVGDRETESATVAVRLRTGEQLAAMTPDEFVGMVQRNVAARSLELK